MRRTTVALIIGLIAGLGTGLPGTSGTARAEEPAETVDGLVKAEIDMPGVLFIRKDHGIGSYDEFLIPEATLSYTRRSPKLDPDMEMEFSVLLEQALVDASDASGIPIADAPGDCVMQINLGFYNVDLEENDEAKTLGQAVLVMEFRDSKSGQPLLRYATENRIENQGPDRSDQLRKGFDKMVAQLDIGAALEKAGLGEEEVRPGCKGTLGVRGRASAKAAKAAKGAKASASD